MPDDRPIQSYALTAHLALIAAANASGVMAERHRNDPTNPERVGTYKHFVECEKRMRQWIVAVERILETEERLLDGGARAGDVSRIKIEDGGDDAAPTGTNLPR